MTLPWLDVVSENNAYERLNREDQSKERYRQGANPDVASRAGEIYRSAPWLTPAQVLAMAKGNASPQAVDLAARLQGERLPQRLEPKPEPRGWFHRNIADRVKAASRWTFATLDVGPDLLQNVASQVWSKNDPAGFDGWFASTKLGTMISAAEGGVDPETGLPLTAGSGWFVGETVESEQERRAKSVRGTINETGWTIGRGAASMVFRPGTRPYNIASGLLDAVVLVGGDPTIVGGKVTGTIKAGRAAVQVVRSADELNAIRKVLRGQAGLLDDTERALVDGSKFYRFWTEDARAGRLVERLADPKLDDPVEVLRDVFNGNMDLTAAARFAEAKSTDEVLDILLDVTNRLDEGNPNLLATDIRDIRGAKWSYERIPLWNTVRHSRAFTEMPEQLVIMGTPEQNVRAVNTLSNYLDTLKGNFTRSTEGKALMRQVFDAYSSGSKAALDAADEAFDAVADTLIRETWTDSAYERALKRAQKLNPDFDDEALDVVARRDPRFRKAQDEAKEVLKAVKSGLKVAQDETRAYFVGQTGQVVDNGFVQAMIDLFPELRAQFDDLSPEQLKQLRLMGPTSVIELLDRTKVLPDIRSVRRITGNAFTRRVLTRKDADPRALLAITEHIQNQVWKPLTLMTGGYIARNMLDAQVRIATTGLAGAFNHPWQWMQWAMYRKAPETITGKNFKEVMEKAAQDAQDAAKNPDKFYEAMTFSLRRNLEDPVHNILGKRTGSYKVVEKAANRDEWFNGLVEELEQLAKDSMFSASAKGIPADSMVAYLKGTEKGGEVLETFSRYLREGIDIVDDNGFPRKISIPEVTDEVLSEWIGRLIEPRVKLKTASDRQIALAVAYRRVPIGKSETVSLRLLDDVEVLPGGPTKFGEGSLFRTVGDDGEAVTAVVQRIVDDPASGQRFAVIQRMSDADWVDDVNARVEFREFLDQRVRSLETNPQTVNQLPKWTKLSEKAAIAKEDSAFTRASDRITDAFFVGLYGKASQVLERSPVFRQFYYQEVVSNTDLLSREAAVDLVAQIKQRAAANKMTPANYVGGRASWAKIQKAALSADGTGDIKQLDEFAKVVALSRTKETLYNATSRSNFEDMMRILIPFGVAHREVLSTYMKFVIQDPTRVRRAQLAYKGFESFDPDGDGQGFFYKDPTTGEATFNFPMSAELTTLLTGVRSPLAAPVKRVSLGLQVLPGIGPVAQIAASNLIPDVPETDGIVSLLLPYGRRSFNIAPAWSTKLVQALRADPTKMETTYANTYTDTLRALAASGDYDLADPQQQANLFEDARRKAQILAGLRAIAQFTGPAAPGNAFIISAKDEDVYASAMVQELYRLQSENYDTAVQRFIETFGDDAFIYLSSKSKATAGGLEASKVFGDWERRNEDLLRQYPSVAAYFAPSGDDFSFEVWSRQFRTGRRKRLSDVEIVEQAQYRMGSAVYRSYRNQVGAYPSSAQREWLRSIRRRIHERYPGFPEVAVFEVGKFESELKALRQLVSDPRLEGNDVAGSLRTYLGYRDQAVARYVAAGGAEGGFDTAKAAEPLRDYLVSIGMTLMQQNPDFGRVWERVLSSEVER